MRKSLSQYGIIDIDMLEVKTVTNELALFRQIVLLVSTWNPDILLGYEVKCFLKNDFDFILLFYFYFLIILQIEMNSWGYVLQRGTLIGFPIHDLLSRIPGTASERKISPEDPTEYNGYTAEKNSDIAIIGRIVLNLWRLLRGEVCIMRFSFCVVFLFYFILFPFNVKIALQSYTFENM